MTRYSRTMRDILMEIRGLNEASDFPPTNVSPCPKCGNVWPSKCTCVVSESVELDEDADKSLKKKADASGISLSILKKVFDRGVAAWKGGHRPGTTPVQWAHARVNSFISGGKTRTTGDADLWKQHKGKSEEVEVDEKFMSRRPSSKEVKMAIGIANDPRYKGGNMTGAVKAIEKIRDGLSKYPEVEAALRKANENLEEGRMKDISMDAELMKLYTKAMKTMPGSPAQKKLIDQINKRRKELGMREEVELDENKNLIKDYEKYMSQSGKTSSNAIDYLMSMPKYKRMTKDQMSKIIGDAKRKGIFKNEYQVEEVELLDEKYDIYHKTFSSAMQHAYDYAKKKLGIEIDSDEIDDKVAMGPRKPSSGKTNKYRLMGMDKKGKSKGVQIQVANLDNKRYELNMYKEEVEITDALVEGMKMNDPKLLRVFDKLKKGSTVKIKHDSTLEKGKDFIEYIVKSKNMVRKGTVEKITMARKDSPTSAKRYLYKRDGKVTMAFGDMAVSPVDIKEEPEKKMDKPDSAKAVDQSRDDKKKTRIAQLQLQIAKATETINKLNSQEKPDA